MASVNDVGIAGQPLNTPPLTDWQEAVRDALNGSDVTVDARIAALTVLGTFTPRAGWADIGGGNSGLNVTRHGPWVTVFGTVLRTGVNQAVGGSNVPIADVPAGFFPTTGRIGSALAFTGTAYTVVRCSVSPVGVVDIQALPAVTINTNGFVAIALPPYRAA